MRRCNLFCVFVDEVNREHCIDARFSALGSNRPSLRILSFQDMSGVTTKAREPVEMIAAPARSPTDFCIKTPPWRLVDPVNPSAQDDLDAKIGKIFRENIEPWA